MAKWFLGEQNEGVGRGTASAYRKAQSLSTEVVGLKAARSLCCQLWLLMEHHQQGGRTHSPQPEAKPERQEEGEMHIKAQPCMAPEAAACGAPGWEGGKHRQRR